MLRKSADFLRKASRQMSRMCHFGARVSSLSLLSASRLHLVGLLRARNCWSAACGGQLDWGGPERGLGHTSQHGPPRSNIFRAHVAPQGNLRQLDQGAEALDKPAERWRQSSWTNGSRFVREKSQQTDGLAKSRPVSLISRSSSANQSPMLDLGISYGLVKCRLGWNSDLTSTKKSGRDRNENSASSSQVWHRDDNPFPRTERSGREMNYQVLGNQGVECRINLQK